jgi:hypothetical protein
MTSTNVAAMATSKPPTIAPTIAAIWLELGFGGGAIVGDGEGEKCAEHVVVDMHKYGFPEYLQYYQLINRKITDF